MPWPILPMERFEGSFRLSLMLCGSRPACSGSFIAKRLSSRHPYMLAFELVGRLLPLASSNSYLCQLLIRCDLEGHHSNAFLPAHHCFHSPGGPLKYSLEARIQSHKKASGAPVCRLRDGVDQRQEDARDNVESIHSMGCRNWRPGQGGEPQCRRRLLRSLPVA